MSMNARRHNRKAKRPDWMERTSSPKPERPTDRKARNKARRAHEQATASYRGGLV
jgi:hypothetical protein